jgi:CubicO group peptidase (beta-lactamase class C family)
MKNLYLLILVVAIGFFSCNSNRSEKEISTDNMNEYLASQLKDTTYLGVIYYKFNNGIDTLYIQGSASRTKKEINIETQFEIGSITKSFTALLIAIAEVEGKLTYNDPIEKFLPDSFIVPENSTGKITIRQLITHTSGLPDEPTDVRIDDPVLGTKDFLNYTADKLYSFLKDYKIEGDGPEPISHSNLGYGLLGFALENTYKDTYNNLVTQKITKPLGMTRTGLNYPKHSNNNYADGYLGLDLFNWYRNDSCVFNGSGALRSCIKDLIVFAEANAGMRETSLYPAMQKMQEVQMPGKILDIDTDICLGWAKYKNGCYTHFGGTMGFVAFIGFHPEEQEINVLLANTPYNMLAIPWLIEFGNNEMSGN